MHRREPPDVLGIQRIIITADLFSAAPTAPRRLFQASFTFFIQIRIGVDQFTTASHMSTRCLIPDLFEHALHEPARATIHAKEKNSEKAVTITTRWHKTSTFRKSASPLAHRDATS